MARFHICQLIGGAFDVESPTLRATPSSEAGIALFFSAIGLSPTAIQIRHWAALARAGNGAPVDCIVWAAIPVTEERRPVGAARLRYEP